MDGFSSLFRLKGYLHFHGASSNDNDNTFLSSSFIQIESIWGDICGVIRSKHCHNYGRYVLMQVGTKVTKKHIMLVEVDLQVSIYLSDDGRYLHFWRPKYCTRSWSIYRVFYILGAGFPHQHFSSSSKSGTINSYSYSIYIYIIHIIHNVFRTWAIRLVNLIWVQQKQAEYLGSV